MPPATILVDARKDAGYTFASLAAALGVHRETVRLWERHSVVPRDPHLRQRVADLLGLWPWPEPPATPKYSPWWASPRVRPRQFPLAIVHRPWSTVSLQHPVAIMPEPSPSL